MSVFAFWHKRMVQDTSNCNNSNLGILPEASTIGYTYSHIFPVYSGYIYIYICSEIEFRHLTTRETLNIMSGVVVDMKQVVACS